MGVQSIRTPVQVRNVTRNRLLHPAIEVTLGEMDRVAEVHHLTKKIGPVAEALQDAGHGLPPGLGTPLVVHLRDLAGGVGILNQRNLALNVLL